MAISSMFNTAVTSYLWTVLELSGDMKLKTLQVDFKNLIEI